MSSTMNHCNECFWFLNGNCENTIVWDSCVETLLKETGNAAPSCKRYTIDKINNLSLKEIT